MKKFIAKAVTFAAVLALGSSLALAALTLETAKQQGLIGEKPDGTVGAVTTPSAEAAAIVASTNAQRLDKYKAIAAKNGTPVDQVEAVAGQKLIAGTPAGQYFMSASGTWQKK